jgi:hypothetical protein
MEALDSERQLLEEKLLEYWKPGVPDTVSRRRTGEFNSLPINEQFRFQSKYLAQYIYQYQEMVNRLPPELIPGGITRPDVGPWLDAGGAFAAHRHIPTMAKNLRALANDLHNYTIIHPSL